MPGPFGAFAAIPVARRTCVMLPMEIGMAVAAVSPPHKNTASLPLIARISEAPLNAGANE